MATTTKKKPGSATAPRERRTDSAPAARTTEAPVARLNEVRTNFARWRFRALGAEVQKTTGRHRATLVSTTARRASPVRIVTAPRPPESGGAADNLTFSGQGLF
jgi:hypothetical protein